MESCTLNWYADRGFELDVDVTSEDVTLRMTGVPVPADGTDELSQGVDLDRLDILFKSQVDIEGGPGQAHEARVRLEGDRLHIDARLEDVETGDIVPLKVSLPVALPSGVPASGGPRPEVTHEDDLDWEDETTLEKMVLQPPDMEAASVAGKKPSGPDASSTGFQALLRALVDGPDDDDFTDEVEPLPEPVRALPEGIEAAPAPTRAPQGAPSDQSMSAEEEAKRLLELLVAGDHLELEDDHEVDELAAGAAAILALPIPGEKKAPRFSEWLLDQPAVADLFIGDDDLGEILDQW